MSRVYTPRDPTRLSGAVVIWLRIFIATTVLGLLGMGLEIAALAALPGRTPASMWTFEAPSAWQQLFISISEFTYLVGYLITGFLVLKWIYRSSRNAHALATGLRISPPWAVGWYFVPIAFLWKPFQGMKEAWQASSNPERWQTEPVPDLLRIWWGLWLFSALSGNLSFRLDASARDAAGLIGSDALQIISFCADVVLSLVLIAIVQRLSRMQVEALRNRTVPEPSAVASTISPP